MLRSARSAALAVGATLAGACSLEPPAPAAAVRALIHARPGIVFDTPQGTSGWLPMHRRNKPVVHGRAAGLEVAVLLDTGAGVTVIDRSLAQRLGLPTAAGGRAVGAGGLAADLTVVHGLDLSLGTLQLHEIPAVAVDLSALRRPGQPPTIILGTQVYHALVIDLDFPRHRLRLHRHGVVPPLRGCFAVPLRAMRDDRIAVPLVVEGTRREFLLDTGADGSVDIFRSAAEQLGLLDRPYRLRTLGGIGGRVRAREISLRAVGLAGEQFADVACYVLDDQNGAAADPPLSGLLGTGILSRFRIVLDYRSAIGQFQRAAAAQATGSGSGWRQRGPRGLLHR